MLSDARKLAIAAAVTVTGIGLGALMVLAEFMNGPREVAAPALAERAVIFLFGAVHVVVAVILTIYRRTAT